VVRPGPAGCGGVCRLLSADRWGPLAKVVSTGAPLQCCHVPDEDEVGADVGRLDPPAVGGFRPTGSELPGDQRPIRVAIAEDSYVIREFLTTTLSSTPEVDLVAVCTNGKELATAIDSSDPDVVLTDIRMPPSGAEEGVRIAARLRESHPRIGVVVLSQYAEPAYAIGLLRDGTGGRAYLLKERIRDKEELVRAINAVARGGSVIDPIIVDVLIDARSHAAKSQLSELTPRERQLLAEIAAGKSNGAIAQSLVLTKRAVEKHVNSIFSKLNLPESEDVSRRVKATLIFLAEEGGDSS
jgi:DNA-binding NarL/FixJ family response regulator